MVTMCDPCLLLSSRFQAEGYREGFDEGTRLGMLEGRTHGASHGARVCAEVSLGPIWRRSPIRLFS